MKVEGAYGEAWHAPSSVVTSFDDGILPFGQAHSGAQPCQNRITGDPRTRVTGTSGPDHLSRTLPATGESPAHLEEGWLLCRFADLSRYSTMSHVTAPEWTRA
ncbi:hypothetical protein DBP15_08810 [Streptomyces sp. CS065A]|nr:hypothetical protein DBP15_08810 [Streptomyces sp. CS065A]